MAATFALDRLGVGQDRVREPLDRVLSSVHRAERLIHDLLDFSQARTGGGIPIRLHDASLHDLARSAAEEFQAAHPAAILRVASRGAGTGEWDPDRLRQVIANLLTNTIAHGREGAPAELLTEIEGERARIVVTNENDRGPIPIEMIPVLFEPFRRGALGFSRVRSIGLGLYIVDQIVRGHRGRVTIISSNESGVTSFIVELPRFATSPAISSKR
jgi:signal transduction histidine kinase